MKLGSLFKLAKGGLGPEEMQEILAAAGMDLSFQAVEVKPESFNPLGEAASLPGAKMMEMRGTMKTGESILALFVVNPAK